MNRTGVRLERRASNVNRDFALATNCDSPCVEVDHGQSLFG